MSRRVEAVERRLLEALDAADARHQENLAAADRRAAESERRLLEAIEAERLQLLAAITGSNERRS